ncbi:hypothetical protein NOI24_16285 [Neorhizobium galegae]|uniref:hypothetical protein n=1 Tax=Neorhizobium galegae TaxID=399 RepID=UPI0021066E43|nr:hypothetical protein [Neorhizobium galegae]MCQ1772869.1 hypothetical protein [Neorhizobium galegae]MCQ1799184.1 hypothetical protein [Neorhizobium galegae]
MPGWEPSNFFGDRFPFAIQTKSDNSDFFEKIGGCNNAIAAIAAFEVVIHAESPKTTVTLSTAKELSGSKKA